MSLLDDHDSNDQIDQDDMDMNAAGHNMNEDSHQYCTLEHDVRHMHYILENDDSYFLDSADVDGEGTGQQSWERHFYLQVEAWLDDEADSTLEDSMDTDEEKDAGTDAGTDDDVEGIPE